MFAVESREPGPEHNKDKEVLTNLEKLHVHDFYEQLGDHFSLTRHTPWPKIKSFVESLENGTKLLDVGCGNGKYFGINKGLIEVGIDFCELLVNKCRERNFEVARAHILNIPFVDNSFDTVISIAVLHHLANKERRIKALEEILRVLKPHGKALIYVWAKDQSSKDGKRSVYAQRRSKEVEINDSQDQDTNDNNKSLKTKNSKFQLPVQKTFTEGEFSENDVLVPWRKKGGKVDDIEQTFQRYYHVFNDGELEGLVNQVQNPPKILELFYEQGNWCVIFEK